MILSENREDGLRKFATNIRLNTLRTLNHLGFGHYGGSLSIVEVLAVLYGEIMPMTPEIFASRDRDYFVLSKGHAGPALYSTLYLNGFFDNPTEPRAVQFLSKIIDHNSDRVQVDA